MNCIACGKEILKRRKNLERNKNNYCNRECYNNRRKSHLKRLKRSSKFYDDLLNISKCECGEDRLYLLQIHHKDGHNTNNYPDNLEIVCSNCHIRRHLRIRADGKWVYHSSSLTPRELLNTL